MSSPEILTVPPFEARTHAIRGLVPGAGFWPARVVVLDVETSTVDSMATFEVAVARLYLRTTEDTYLYSEELVALSAHDLWVGVDGWTRGKGTMRVYSHNSTFDFGVTNALRHMGDLGYTGEPGRTIAMGSDGQPWMILHRTMPSGYPRASVSLTDSCSLLGNVGVKQLARDLELGKQPVLGDDHDGRVERARFDVHVVATAILEHLYPALEEWGVAPRGVSGAGTGFNVYRTLHYPPKSAVWHGYEPLFELEERAGGGGRREAWRAGAIAEPLESWDYEHAHPVICMEPLPVRQKDPWAVNQSSNVAYLHRVLIDVPVPVVPYDHPKKGRIFPVGRFESVMWGDELALAISTGAEVREHRETWAYHTEPIMAEWAEWIIGNLIGCSDKVLMHCFKQWSHTTVGKFGSRLSKYDEVTDSRRWPEWEVDYFGRGGIAMSKVSGADHDREIYWPDGAGAGRIFQVTDRGTVSDNSVPAITSYVMARARVKLWRGMMAAGLENVVNVNTDGLIVTRKGGNRLRRKPIHGLRIKERYPKGILVWGANGWTEIEGDARRVAGLKRGAIEIAAGVFEQTEVQHALAAGIGGEGIRMGTRTLTLAEHAMGRKRRRDGSTEPWRVREK